MKTISSAVHITFSQIVWLARKIFILIFFPWRENELHLFLLRFSFALTPMVREYFQRHILQCFPSCRAHGLMLWMGLQSFWENLVVNIAVLINRNISLHCMHRFIFLVSDQRIIISGVANIVAHFNEYTIQSIFLTGCGVYRSKKTNECLKNWKNIMCDMAFRVRYFSSESNDGFSFS